jgi:hypothetical protein
MRLVAKNGETCSPQPVKHHFFAFWGWFWKPELFKSVKVFSPPGGLK